MALRRPAARGRRAGVEREGPPRERGGGVRRRSWEVGERVRGQADENPPVWGTVHQSPRRREPPPRRVYVCPQGGGPPLDDEPCGRRTQRRGCSTHRASCREGEERGEEGKERQRERTEQGEGSEPEEKAEEERREELRRQKRTKEDLLERGGKEGVAGRLWRHRDRSRSALPAQICGKGSQEGKEERSQLVFQPHVGHQEPEHKREEHRVVCRRSQDQENGEAGTGSTHLRRLPGHPELAVDSQRRRLGFGGWSDSASGMPILPADHAIEAAGRTGPRGPDSGVVAGSPFTRPSSRSLRRPHSEVQELRNERGRSLVDDLAEGGARSSRTTSAQLSCRDAGGYQREQRGTEDQKRGCTAARKGGFRKFLLERRRKGQGQRRKEQRKEGQGEGRRQAGREMTKGSSHTMSPDPKGGELTSQGRPESAMSSVPARLVGDGTLGTAAEGRFLCPVVPADHPADPAFDPRSEREKECMKPPCMGDRFVAVAPWMTFTLRRAVSSLGLPLQCTTQPSGDIFPLPTNVEVLQVHSGVEPSEVETLRGLCLGVNSMYGLALENAFPPNSHQEGVLKFLLSQSQLVSSWTEHFEETNWHDFFKLKTVDYTGEEVLCAQYTSWENLAPAMPKEIASVPLVEVCELGCRHYVENFVSYVLPEEMQQPMKPPRVLITNEAWRDVCKGLLGNGVCIPMLEQDLFHVGDQPLLNGLFGVPKGEQEQGVEIHRLIMDLRPRNKVVRGIEGDVSTLPTWATMAPLQLMPSEDLVISSEDVRCFFYIFKIPREWSAFLGFNRPIPPELCPDNQGTYYLASQVLPMGFKNSVSLAQHVHRVMVRRAGSEKGVHLQSHQEIRKDRPFTSHPELHRVYLDNFDLLEKVDKRTTALLRGELSESVLALRNEYERWGVPRHPKKSVVREHKAEVQGAIIDGIAGRAYPKPVKIMKYAQLASLLVGEKRCSMKQAQVVAGGLVYMSMFRRPLLGSLNALWKFIESFKGYPPVVHLEIPAEVKLEVARFVCLIPLAQMDFRLNISPEVTASDASTTGGGLTASVGLTGFGQAAAAAATVRGDLPEPADVCAVLAVGLFDGIGALRVAADACQLPVLGHISVEVKKEASRVLESKFPSTLFVEGGVESVDDEMVRSWACQFSQAAVVILGAGPPCQGVSGLNSERRGALKDHRSCLFSHVRRIKELLKKHFKWAQVRYLVENVSSMDDKDRTIMTEDYGDYPVMIDAAGVSLARRPRLYWCDWELLQGRVFTSDLGSTVVWRPFRRLSSWHRWTLKTIFSRAVQRPAKNLSLPLPRRGQGHNVEGSLPAWSG